MTPLHVAAERGYIKIVNYLVGKGADIDIQDEKGVIILWLFQQQLLLWVWASLIHLRIKRILDGFEPIAKVSVYTIVICYHNQLIDWDVTNLLISKLLPTITVI